MFLRRYSLLDLQRIRFQNQATNSQIAGRLDTLQTSNRLGLEGIQQMIYTPPAV
jgi:hypothetical protein